MHATFIPLFLEDNSNPMLCDWPQDIIFLNDLPSNDKFHEFHGQVKGMKAVFEPKEWGLWDYLYAQNGDKSLPENCHLM